MTEKQIIRNRIKQILESYDCSTIEQASETIMRKLMAGQWWKESDAVLMYLSFRKEVITDPLVEAAVRAGKVVGVPRVESDRIRFFPVTSVQDDCELSRMGIREPRRGSAAIEFDALSEKHVLAIVPGRAFDRSKNRIGWGGGYYDRWIRSARIKTNLRFIAVALCFHDQLLTELPHGPADEPVDAVITEEEIIL